MPRRSIRTLVSRSGFDDNSPGVLRRLGVGDRVRYGKVDEMTLNQQIARIVARLVEAQSILDFEMKWRAIDDAKRMIDELLGSRTQESASAIKES